jgi:hypothetical protein
MSQKSGSHTPRSQTLTFERDRLIASRELREAVFNYISHEKAGETLDTVYWAEWLHYYKAPVLLPEQVDIFYGVEPLTCDRLIRCFEDALREDGLFSIPESFLAQAEETLGVCWIGKPSLSLLLPPRAVLKLACFMPATISTMAAIDGITALATPTYCPLAPKAKISQHYRDRQRRILPKDRNFLVEEAKEAGVYAYAQHFGHLRSGVTWERLVTHHRRGGQFPPTRAQLNGIVFEF